MPRFYLILILIFTAVTRLYLLGNPDQYVFDEVYHVVTIKAYAQNNPAGYEWWHQPPESNTAYEWLHPPLAKLIQAGSVKVLGNSSFAWRFTSALFGVLSVAAVYFLAQTLFKSQPVALTAALILSLDNLHLTMSRITMNDIFVTTFIVLALTFFFKKRWYLTGLFTGLALATKHSAVFLYPIFTLWLLYRRPKGKDWFKLIYSLTIIPLAIYFMSFTQFFFQGHSLTDFWHLHQQIWWYQTGLKATHSYQSTALTWPLLVRPVWFYVKYFPDKIANIYNLGNPTIFWGGVVATVYTFFKRRFTQPIVFLLLSYGLFFLPLALSPRILFLHHYLPALPFLVIILGYTLNQFKKFRPWFLLLAAAAFFFFYPINTAIPLPSTWLKYWFWLKSWK